MFQNIVRRSDKWKSEWTSSSSAVPIGTRGPTATPTCTVRGCRGLPAHAFDGRPHIAIANTASDLTLGSAMRARALAEGLPVVISIRRNGQRLSTQIRGTGPVGGVAASGLPQVDDHRFVVTALERFLA